MQYLKCRWIHNFDDEPILIYSELDNDRFELKKIHIYRNGEIGYAYQEIEFLDTRLGEVPVPEIEEIRADPQFVPEYIAEEEFQKIWNEKIAR